MWKTDQVSNLGIPLHCLLSVPPSLSGPLDCYSNVTLILQLEINLAPSVIISPCIAELILFKKFHLSVFISFAYGYTILAIFLSIVVFH